MANKYRPVLMLMICFILIGGQTASAAPQQAPEMAMGDHGPAVAALELRLATLGYRVGPVDGLFEERTYMAVRQYQLDHQLPDSGLADSATLKAVEEEHDPVYGDLHIVQAGESLTAIAREHGTLAAAINQWNRLYDPALKEGEILRLPVWTYGAGGYRSAAQPSAAGTRMRRPSMVLRPLQMPEKQLLTPALPLQPNRRRRYRTVRAAPWFWATTQKIGLGTGFR